MGNLSTMPPVKKQDQLPLEVRLLLDVILGLMQQYMPQEGNKFSHQNMKAGEDASDALMHYGIGDDDGYHIVLDTIKTDGIQESVYAKSFQDL